MIQLLMETGSEAFLMKEATGHHMSTYLVISYNYHQTTLTLVIQFVFYFRGSDGRFP